MKFNDELVKYLIDNHIILLSQPVLGQLKDIYILFAMYLERWLNKKTGALRFKKFYNDLIDISQICQGSLIFTGNKDAPFSSISKLEFIYTLPLKIMYNKAHINYYEINDVNEINAGSLNNNNSHPLLDRLIYTLDQDITTPNRNLLRKVEMLLETKPASFRLGKEKAKLITPYIPYINICSDSQHSSILSNIAKMSGNRIISLQLDKLNKFENGSSDLTTCIKSKIHFIPNLKPQTDLTLGDCSYLDTCHKLNSCRYIHYVQYCSEQLMKNIIEETNAKNIEQTKNNRIGFYTHGDCCSQNCKALLPPQWIKCDLRKFDFKILGKFSCVIADPAWNIHMNLPYGTCNDNELLQLPLYELQDEGLIFLWVTGRAIELGKESLSNWNYEVISEISWIKTNQLGRTIVTGRTGHWLNHSKEHLIVGLKGNPKWLKRQIDLDLIISPTRETSRKPDELYSMIERIVGPHARKLEIFGRDHNIRSGWFTIGNQVNGTCIHELDVKMKYEAFTSKTNESLEKQAIDSLIDKVELNPTNPQIPYVYAKS